MHIDEEALLSSLQRLRQATLDADVAGIMKRAVNSVHGVFGCTGAGTMFITETGLLTYVAATDESGRELEEAQAMVGQGPCYDAYVYASEITTGDLHADGRWPDLPVGRLPRVRAVAGLPIVLGGSPVGTLNVYRDEPTDWDGSDVAALRAYSDLVAEAIGAALAAREHSALADQLRYALDYRVVIERAVGFLMGAHSLDAVTAFNVLRKRARDSRRRVADVAAEVLEDTGQGTPAELPGPPRRVCARPAGRGTVPGQLPPCVRGSRFPGRRSVVALRIRAERQGQQLTLRVRGELDFASRGRLMTAVTAVPGLRDAPLVVLDLSALRFADCAGLAAIVWAYGYLSERGQDLKVTGARPMVRRLLDITGLDTYLPLG